MALILRYRRVIKYLESELILYIKKKKKNRCSYNEIFSQ